jgi:membrane protease subunit (stomatin/prohibitin family)
MSAIIIALLALIALGVVLHPLFYDEGWRSAPALALDPKLESLLSAREATYGAIKDLESDHAQGKLSDSDYQNLRAKYETKALAILQQLNLIETNSAIRAKVAARGCAQCALPSNRGDKFCARCGANLGAPACALCSEPIKPEWKFCKSCGAPVVALQAA